MQNGRGFCWIHVVFNRIRQQGEYHRLVQELSFIIHMQLTGNGSPCVVLRLTVFVDSAMVYHNSALCRTSRISLMSVLDFMVIKNSTLIRLFHWPRGRASSGGAAREKVEIFPTLRNMRGTVRAAIFTRFDTMLECEQSSKVLSIFYYAPQQVTCVLSGTEMMHFLLNGLLLRIPPAAGAYKSPLR